MTLSIVTWKWRRIDGSSTFTSEHVNALQRNVARHYPDPHRFLCVTDDPAGLSSRVEVVPDVADFADLPSPHGGFAPACYRRLRLFREDAARWFGERFVSLDLDTLATADLRPLWNRSEDFVGYRDPLYPTQLNGSMLLMSAGARSRVWSTFDPLRSPQLALDAGKRGSDQGWISYCLRREAQWSTRDGVYSFRKDIERNGGALPADARLTIWHGHRNPWDEQAQTLPWVREHYASGI